MTRSVARSLVLVGVLGAAALYAPDAVGAWKLTRGAMIGIF